MTVGKTDGVKNQANQALSDMDLNILKAFPSKVKEIEKLFSSLTETEVAQLGDNLSKDLLASFLIMRVAVRTPLQTAQKQFSNQVELNDLLHRPSSTHPANVLEEAHRRSDLLEEGVMSQQIHGPLYMLNTKLLNISNNLNLFMSYGNNDRPYLFNWKIDDIKNPTRMVTNLLKALVKAEETSQDQIKNFGVDNGEPVSVLRRMAFLNDDLLRTPIKSLNGFILKLNNIAEEIKKIRGQA